MKVKTSAIESVEVKEICESAKMESEIVNIVCHSNDSFDAIVERLQNDEDMEDYCDNNGVMEIWGTRRCSAGENEYRIHVFTTSTERRNLGI